MDEDQKVKNTLFFLLFIDSCVRLDVTKMFISILLTFFLLNALAETIHDKNLIFCDRDFPDECKEVI